MDQSLNLRKLTSAAARKGLSQARIAEHLAVSREAVSKWFSGKALPRPDKLLRLAFLVGLGFEELVAAEQNLAEPIVAFRKRGARKITEARVAHAKEIGATLSCLVPFLPFNKLMQPPRLKDPRVDYTYLQSVSEQVRSQLKVEPTDVLDFTHLVGTFREAQAVLIPVMWGEKADHDNALHIYLPESGTTWIYLNLDSHLVDFKFWMAHELGHVYSPDLRGNDAEDFADAFAATLLFPKSLAEQVYKRVSIKKLKESRVRLLQDYAQKFLISPISVFKEMNSYARANELPEVGMGTTVYSSTQNFKKQLPTISQILFSGKEPTAASYISKVNEAFQTAFFDALRAYLAESKKPAGFVQAVLDVPFLDAKSIHAELV